MGSPVSPAAAKKLLAGKSVMLKGLQRKDGSTVDRLVVLDPQQGWRPRIAADQSVKVGTCPKCGGRVLDVGNERVPFLCEHNRSGVQEGAQPVCDFRLYRDYLGKKLGKTDVAALLAGKTVTLKGLTSQKTGALFDAFVAIDAERGYRPRITGYPPQSERTAKANASAKAAAEKAARQASQATLPGFEW